MAKISFRQKAIEDLPDIWNYTRRTWSEDQADRYFLMIQSACNDLALGKAAGRRSHRISDDILGYLIGKHITFYRQTAEDEIEVIRILHERMDIGNRRGE